MPSKSALLLGGNTRTVLELKPLSLRPDTLSLDIKRSFPTIVVSLRVTGHANSWMSSFACITGMSVTTVSGTVTELQTSIA